MIELIRPQTALLSVSDKNQLDIIAHTLHHEGVTLIASGGTAQFLKEQTIPHTTIEDMTQMPSLLGGRVKTLHPIIHGGILARQPQDDQDLQKLKAQLIDIVIVNLYPFEQQLEQTQDKAKLIEFIDIGGPALLRAAAKNHERVLALCQPSQYEPFLAHLKQNNGTTTLAYRQQCAAEAFTQTQHYDAAIAKWFMGSNDDTHRLSHRLPSQIEVKPALPSHIELKASLSLPTRYGENPHQQGAFYETSTLSIAHAKKWQGKELSWNNINDADLALALACRLKSPAAVVVKHATPSGVAQAQTLPAALERAIQADPVSAFGGIIVLNGVLDEECATIIKEGFFELILAPRIEESALTLLASKKNLRLLSDENLFTPPPPTLDVRSLRGGWLVQESDDKPSAIDNWQCQCNEPAQSSIKNDLLFAWNVVRYARSNAIVIAIDGQTIGIGDGATSRIDALQSAIRHALKNHGKESLKNAVLASDAFFPFDDSIHAAAEVGITAIVAAGGSQRDEEIIEAAKQHEMTLYFADKRHFRH